MLLVLMVDLLEKLQELSLIGDIPDYDIYLTDRQEGHEVGTAVEVKNSISHTYVDLHLHF
jgi:hypothetical protein